MRNSILAGLCVTAAIAGPAAAQERPRYLPTRDVTVQYQITSSQPGAPTSVVAHISASGQVRLETGDRGYVLYNANSGHAQWVLPQSEHVHRPPGGRLARGVR